MRRLFLLLLCLGAAAAAAALPAGVQAVWDLEHAYREATPTRERICLNGLWQWQPAESGTESPVPPTVGPPDVAWGWFKVPGSWPGITNYNQKDCQTVFAHPAWEGQDLGRLTAAWYQRDLQVPAAWEGRRISLRLEQLNSLAEVFLDGERQGVIRFPGGELDLTAACRPGSAHRLSLHVQALPLQAVMLSYTDSASAREVQGSVARRGLCGDAYLIGVPRGPRLAGVRVEPSVRRRQCTFEAHLEGLAQEERFTLRTQILEGERTLREFSSPSFRGRDVRPSPTGAAGAGRFAFTVDWLPDHLWDLHTPGNTYEVQVSLLDTAGRVLDADWRSRFGFRELWIEGRDFFLNGSRVFLCAVPLDNAQVGAAWANYAAARESLERLKGIGVNFVYTHNYSCEPGAHLAFEEILRAADDVGVLVALSQPHFGHYDGRGLGARPSSGYREHAEYYTRVAGNHPSVVMYAMSHNAAGYSEDMNPELIDGRRDRRSLREKWTAVRARRAEAVVRELDPGRIVYHHAGGNLGAMHVVNFYPNFVPIQEMSDWFQHWSAKGVKPLFTCEYAAPFPWDWTMYRGWYQGRRAFGSAVVPWEFCLAEWNAQFLGDRAYQISEPEKANLRWEAQQLRAGKLWHRWDYPFEVNSTRLEERFPVYARYLDDNWRAFRTLGVSALSPWIFSLFWKPRDGVGRGRREYRVDWPNLQRPGFSPDYEEERYERLDLAFERSDWVATPASRSLLRHNRPLFAFIGGKPAAFTAKDHLFLPGETVEKQLIVLNNSRRTVTCECSWSLALPQALSGSCRVTIDTGQQERIPLRFELPPSLAPGSYSLDARFCFDSGETQEDRFRIDVLSAPPPTPSAGEARTKIALFDPKGESGALLRRLGIPFQPVKTRADLTACNLLIVGRSALSPRGKAPDIGRVREGLKVLVFEQTSETMEQRFGFRTAEYGLREVFARVPDHSALAGLGAEGLRDWRGEATLLPPRLKYRLRPTHGPTVRWCGLPVTRLWRCGNRGSVTSVLIEKPARGDFLPVLDGGFSLQYSPLLEYREGRGLVLFCQLDVTGRTEAEPAADRLVRNLLAYLASWEPEPERPALYAGEAAGARHLEAAGVTVRPYAGRDLSPGEVLVVGPGGGAALAGRQEAVAQWLAAGGRLLGVGLAQTDVDAFLPFPLELKTGEHIAAYFEPTGWRSHLAGVGPADVHNRDPRELPLVASGAWVLGNGILAQAEGVQAVFCQLAPWQFESTSGQANLRRTHRRASFLLSRLLANLGVRGSTPLFERFRRPVRFLPPEKRWLSGFYLDRPEEWDDPYRFFRW